MPKGLTLSQFVFKCGFVVGALRPSSSSSSSSSPSHHFNMSSPNIIHSVSFYAGKKASAKPLGLSKRKRTVKRFPSASKKVIKMKLPASRAQVQQQAVAPSSPAGSLPPPPEADEQQGSDAVADLKAADVDLCVPATDGGDDPATGTSNCPPLESDANSPAADTPVNVEKQQLISMDLDENARVSPRVEDFADEAEVELEEEVPVNSGHMGMISSDEDVLGGPKKRRKSAMVVLTEEDERWISQWLEVEGEFIYNKGLNSYKDKAKVAKAFARLGSRCNPPITGDQMRTWFYSLRTRFGRLTTGKSGQGAMKRMTAREKWILDLFHFLKPHIVRQRRTAQIGLNEVSIFYLL